MSVSAHAPAPPLLQRFKALARFIIYRDVELFASSIAYNAMLGIFPGLLALTFAQRALGYRFVAFQHAAELSAITPQPIIDLMDSYLSRNADASVAALSASFLLFVALIMKSVAGTFAGFLAMIERLTGHEATILRKKASAGVAAVCVLFFSALLFIISNLETLSNPVWIAGKELGHILHVRMLVSALLIVIGMASFFRVIAGKTLSGRAHWFGAAIASALWLGGCFLFFSYKFDFAEEQRLYGTVTTTIAMLLWFYVTAYAILIGVAFAYFVVDGKKSP